jgi:hypothetical protein
LRGRALEDGLLVLLLRLARDLACFLDFILYATKISVSESSP